MKTRFGIMGPGGIAHKFAKAVNMCDNAVITAVASRDLEKAKNFAQEYSVENFYDSYEKLAQDENVDVVYISVVNNHHFALAKMAIENGKAVMCEKPLVTNLCECRELIDLAKEKNVLFMEAMWPRFLPNYIMAKKWLNEGKIGEAKLMNASFCFNAPYNPNSRLYDPSQAGGAVLDVGCYVTAITLDFCGGTKPVLTKGLARFAPSNVDELGAAVMMFENNMIATISFGVSVKTLHDATIFGSNGRIHMKHFYNGGEISLYDTKDNLLETYNVQEENGFVFEVAHMAELFQKGEKESPIMSLQNSLDCMEVLDALSASFQEDLNNYSEISKLDF